MTAIPGPVLVCECGHNVTVHWAGHGCRKCECQGYKHPAQLARCNCDHCRGLVSDHCACGHLLADHRMPWHICDKCLFCDTFRVSRDGR